MPSIHSIVSTLWVVRSQSTVGHAKIRIVAGVLRHLGQRGRFQPQIHLHRDRARHGVDDLDQPQPPRFGRIGFGLVRDKEEIGEVAAEARGDIGPQHLDRDRLAHAVALDLAAMHLRDRGRGDRRAEARKGLRHRAFQRRPRSRPRPRLARTAAAGPAGFPDRAPSTTPTTSGRVARNCPSLR